MSVIQFTISKAAAAAVNLEQTKPRARDAGVEDLRFGYSEFRVGFGKVRVTCSRPMAAFLLEQLRAAPGGHDARMTAIAEIERELAAEVAATASVPSQRLGM